MNTELPQAHIYNTNITRFPADPIRQVNVLLKHREIYRFEATVTQGVDGSITINTKFPCVSGYVPQEVEAMRDMLAACNHIIERDCQ